MIPIGGYLPIGCQLEFTVSSFSIFYYIRQWPTNTILIKQYRQAFSFPFSKKHDWTVISKPSPIVNLEVETNWRRFERVAISILTKPLVTLIVNLFRIYPTTSKPSFSSVLILFFWVIIFLINYKRRSNR